jgi:hypothetical protein
MTKKVSIAKLKGVCAKLTQKLVRLKAADKNGMVECVTCGKIDHWKGMQGGHFIERGKSATVLMEENIHPQCPGCNMYRMKQASTVLTYRRYMVDMYGEDFVQELERMSRQPKKFYTAELNELKRELNERIKQRESEIS